MFGIDFKNAWMITVWIKLMACAVQPWDTVFDQRAMSLACSCWQFHPIFDWMSKNQSAVSRADWSKFSLRVWCHMRCCTVSFFFSSSSIQHRMRRQDFSQGNRFRFAIRLLLLAAPMPADMVIADVSPDSEVPGLLLISHFKASFSIHSLHCSISFRKT